ncbi:MAG: nuclear transport factor 2 family protein [Methanobacterium sp.]|nr:nuclear transport factor 2 family protein [Methanobacterium sp.]
MKATKEIVDSVHTILKIYKRAYFEKDLDGIVNLFVQDPDLVAIGAGRDEWVKGPEELKNGFKRDLAQADEINMDFEDVNVSASGNVAWTSARMAMHILIKGEKIAMFGRLSLVLEEKEDNWLISHLHFSIPDEQEEGQSYPV